MPPKSKDPKCCRCRNHGVISKLKGHKHFCRWKECTCPKCILLSKRQQISKEQIRIRRQQDLDQERLGSITLPVLPPENTECTDSGKFLPTQQLPTPMSVQSWGTGENNKGVITSPIHNGSFNSIPVHHHDGAHFFPPPAAAFAPHYPVFNTMPRYQAAPFGGHSPYSQFSYAFRPSSPYCVPYQHNTNFSFPAFTQPVPNTYRHQEDCVQEDTDNTLQSGSYTLLRPMEQHSFETDISQDTTSDK